MNRRYRKPTSSSAPRSGKAKAYSKKTKPTKRSSGPTKPKATRSTRTTSKEQALFEAILRNPDNELNQG